MPVPLTKGMKPKEHFWSAEIISLAENAWIKMSNRVGTAFLNRLLHRQGTDSLKMKTLSEMCDRHGNEIVDYQNQHARDVLIEHHFDPNTGKPWYDADLNALQDNVPEEISPERKAQINDYIGKYNGSKQDGISIQMTDQQWVDLETPDMPAVYIALDGVGVKRQKDKREPDKEKQSDTDFTVTEDLSAAPKPKGRPSVETSVAHISVNNNRYVLLADSMMTLYYETRPLESREKATNSPSPLKGPSKWLVITAMLETALFYAGVFVADSGVHPSSFSLLRCELIFFSVLNWL